MAEANEEEQESKSATAPLSDAVKAEIEALTGAERAAVIMLLLGEQQAADIIRYLSPREVQNLGAYIQVHDFHNTVSNLYMCFW